MSFDPSRLHRLSGCGPLVMVVAVACDLSGQVPTPSNPHVPTDDSYSTRFVAFSPRSGPPGTEVTVSAKDLPAVTPVYLGMGAARSGFEVLGQLLLTDGYGEMSKTVEIPSWATRDRSHFFVLLDVYFRPLTLSDAFYVTDLDGMLLRKGRSQERGKEILPTPHLNTDHADGGPLYAIGRFQKDALHHHTVPGLQPLRRTRQGVEFTVLRLPLPTHGEAIHSLVRRPMKEDPKLARDARPLAA